MERKKKKRTIRERGKKARRTINKERKEKKVRA